MKRCSHCKQEKPAGEFSPRSYRNGTITLQSWCKACHRARWSERTQKRKRERASLIPPASDGRRWRKAARRVDWYDPKSQGIPVYNPTWSALEGHIHG